MFAVTRPLPAKSTDAKHFFVGIYKNIIEDPYLFTEKSQIFIFRAI